VTRIAVSRSAVSYADTSERNGTIQLDVLRRYADAVDADVHYVLVPRGKRSPTGRQRGWTTTAFSTASPNRPRRQPFLLESIRVNVQSELTSHRGECELWLVVNPYGPKNVHRHATPLNATTRLSFPNDQGTERAARWRRSSHSSHSRDVEVHASVTATHRSCRTSSQRTNR
jgi:hypothetical protein